MDFNASRRAEVQATANAGIVPEMLYPELFPRDHDFILVAGDLNYRLNLSYEEAVSQTQRGELGELLRHDQLATELKNPHTPWKGFLALTPNHVPTYRFDIGTDTYDTSEKHRVPSFTDRICIWAKRPAALRRVCVDEHVALMRVRSSDHKPVRALLRLPIQVEVPEEKEKVLASLRQKVAGLGLDRAASSKVSLDATLLDFGQLQFHQCGEVRTVVLTNTGDSVAVVRVLRQKPQQNEAEDGAWTRVSPLEFAVLPGESQEVRIETAIDPRCMGWLSRWRPYKGNGRVAISAMLLFAVRNGPVQAVDCRAVLLPSVFANSLENISMLGALPCMAAYQAKMDDKTLLQSLRPQIPKELWYLADAVQRQPLMKDLFAATLDVDSDVCHAIMAHLDTTAAPLPAEGEPGSFNVYCVCECVLAFLKNLQEPVVPYSMYTQALAAGRAKGKAPLAFIAQLPNAHANVWIYMVSLLNYLLRPAHVQHNRLTPSLLAYVFSAAMIVRPVADQGLTSARLLQGGGVDQQVRQQLHQEREDAKDLVEYFLTAAPTYMQ
ncbi:phosphatidylinositol-bisphosphatase [Strigomonas culicis]|uniref:Phosphatidylinositol-bisphosphatase n=1 Tax=Strigomonas culicis TaxID=28005 RepID=S9V0P2_9TRYP|nr:phosphatidylinositol-bisphosphatase [Strigomonas culicis]|eukprot:EPY34573.1 phosphatidylinositol-bisphosphatase [Strigomonas culicis]